MKIGKLALAAVFLVVAACNMTTAPTSPSGNRVFSILDNTAIERPLSHGASYQFAMVSNFTRRGELAQRFEIRHGDCGRHSSWSDCENDRQRVERKERPKNTFSRPGQAVWYGYSVYIPSDFVSLGRGSTVLGQAKIEDESFPLWLTSFGDNPYILFTGGENCNLPPLSTWRGRWNDITVYANYATGGQDVYFQFYRNGTLLCEHRNPLVPDSFRGRSQQIGFKYGIYNSWVSRYLAANATRPLPAESFSQRQTTGSVSRSPSGRPFEHDWGVRLPTHVIHYDEMLSGSRREDVDVRMREAAGLPPVD